jgi:hypothetical protein
VPPDALVFLSAVREYLIAEVLELAGNEARNNKLGIITPQHVWISISNDEELNNMFGSWAWGGMGESHFPYQMELFDTRSTQCGAPLAHVGSEDERNERSLGDPWEKQYAMLVGPVDHTKPLPRATTTALALASLETMHAVNAETDSSACHDSSDLRIPRTLGAMASLKAARRGLTPDAGLTVLPRTLAADQMLGYHCGGAAKFARHENPGTEDIDAAVGDAPYSHPHESDSESDEDEEYVPVKGEPDCRTDSMDATTWDLDEHVEQDEELDPDPPDEVLAEYQNDHHAHAMMGGARTCTRWKTFHENTQVPRQHKEDEYYPQSTFREASSTTDACSAGASDRAKSMPLQSVCRLALMAGVVAIDDASVAETMTSLLQDWLQSTIETALVREGGATALTASPAPLTPPAASVDWLVGVGSLFNAEPRAQTSSSAAWPILETGYVIKSIDTTVAGIRPGSEQRVPSCTGGGAPSTAYIFDAIGMFTDHHGDPAPAISSAGEYSELFAWQCHRQKNVA